ncbi:gas vesicle protein GvpG [Pseudonocardia nematodicida]|uniref:Gas vesicle protein GvpG n=1 Tax=Pseudonocardia nematodicida TaxID=1206997 RepID=A0ABV1KHV6_9PSEU
MGLITGLLGLPLAPVRGVVWVGEQLRDQAHARLYDPAAVRRQIDEVERAYTRGEITEAERDEQQEILLERLVEGPGAGGGG